MRLGFQTFRFGNAPLYIRIDALSLHFLGFPEGRIADPVPKLLQWGGVSAFSSLCVNEYPQALHIRLRLLLYIDAYVFWWIFIPRVCICYPQTCKSTHTEFCSGFDWPPLVDGEIGHLRLVEVRLIWPWPGHLSCEKIRKNLWVDCVSEFWRCMVYLYSESIWVSGLSDIKFEILKDLDPSFLVAYLYVKLLIHLIFWVKTFFPITCECGCWEMKGTWFVLWYLIEGRNSVANYVLISILHHLRLWLCFQLCP